MRTREEITEQATDKGCCSLCHRFGSWEFGCKNPNCPCHQASTPSLSEGEGWEKEFDEAFIERVAGGYEYINEDFVSGKQIKSFIRTLLSQTLSNERQRMVEVGEELKESGIRCRDREWECDSYNAAISEYQQKIKSLTT